MEELLAILAASGVDAALIATIKAQVLAKKVAVRSETDETTFKTNLLASSKEDIIKEEKKTWMRRIEDDIKELTGLTQKAGEPYHEFMKRGFKKVQELKDAAEAKVHEFETGEGGGVWKTKYTTLEAQSKAAIEAKEKELADFKKLNEVTQRSVELNKIVAPLEARFISEVPGYFKDYKEGVLKEVLSKSAIIDGKLVLVDEQGSPMKDANLGNILVETHLAERFKDVIKVEKQQAGAGSKKPDKTDVPAAGSKAKPGKEIDTTDAPKEFANQGEVITYLGKKGALQGTPEFNTAFDKLVEEKNVTKIF